jgi:hypothetical protein
VATELYAGPVDYLVFAFPAGVRADSGLTALLDRVDAGLIEILDVECLSIGTDGSAVRQPLTEIVDVPLAHAFEGAESDILDETDLAAIAETLSLGERALAVVYEERSLAAAVDAWTADGGRIIMTGGVEIDDLELSLSDTQEVAR